MSEATEDKTIDPAPWTLKGVPTETRNAAIMAAKRAGQPIGVWAARVLLAGAQAELTGARALVVVPGVPEAPADSGRVALADAERVARAFSEMAAAGVPVAKTHARKVQARLVAQLKAVG